VKIPSGYTEEQVLEDIEYVTERLSRHFKFGYYTKEDIKQEGCLEALRGIKKYNPHRGTTLRTFLYTHVRNRFINMRRNKCFSQNMPCVGCGFRDKNKKKAKSGCHEFDDKIKCESYRRWADANKRKGNLINSYGIIKSSDDNLDIPINFDVVDHIYKKEILQIIDENLPFSFREDYCRFLQGARISQTKKELLIEAIKSLLNDKGILINTDDGEI